MYFRALWSSNEPSKLVYLVGFYLVGFLSVGIFLLCFNFGYLPFQRGKEIAFALHFGIFSVIELGDSII